MISKKIGIIGCGNMGEALLRRLSDVVEKSTTLMVSEMDSARREAIQSRYKIIVEIDNSYLVKYSDVVILAVKPKDFDKVLKEEVRGALDKTKLLISVAAGIKTAHIEKLVGKDISVIRVMPNMAAVIGEAVSSVSAGRRAGKEDIELAKEIFSTVGEVVEVKEELVDAVTAVSGSGPAYFFYLMESLMKSAESLGLEKDIARRLVIKTALGSAKLLDFLKEDPAVMRAKVTSKGGTTEAAIKIFDSKKLRSIIMEAVKKACQHSKKMVASSGLGQVKKGR
ncbi:MAG: pyrroline-5-carboxylate reductase [Candidatus Omnitrophica bacterium]|nr:pyrroline-5-carboxylate reductase [Candidatus Omnitrophota bacterium]